MIDRMRRRAAEHARNQAAADSTKQANAVRVVTPASPGSAGDLADRFNAAGAYQPNAHPEYAGATDLEKLALAGRDIAQKGAAAVQGIVSAVTGRRKKKAGT